MEIPPSFDAAFRLQTAIGERIQELAGSRLRLLCDDRAWLFADRVKSTESALAKLQIGLVRDLSQMWDLYGATVVVPTRKDIPDAVDAVLAEFPAARRGRLVRGDAATFQYDDVHVKAKLKTRAPGEPREIRERAFEIQIRTGLQFAWWRATHDKIYKGGVKDWRLERVASQVRGNLELLDGVLSDLDVGAALLERQATDLDEDYTAAVGWLDRWDPTNRPDDLKAYAEAVTDLLVGGGVSMAGGDYLLATPRGQSLIANHRLTPVQAMLILIVELRGIAAVLRRGKQPGRNHRKRWILVTTEMEQVAAILRAVPDDRRVQL